MDREQPQVSDELKVTAIVAAFNEADILVHSLGDLIDQGIRVVVLDDGSTDGSADSVARWIGKGLIAAEALPLSDPPDFSLRRIIARKQELAAELEADWFINHDADEFREGPWAHLNLMESIRLVDRLGYNAIDFEVLNFWPTTETPEAAGDPRTSLRFYDRGKQVDRLQIRCWKNTGAPLDLVSSGGHEAVFPGRRVFPIRFLLRHYPFRSEAHGRRKLLEERMPRYAADEIDEGWHRQHEVSEIPGGFLRDPQELTLFDPERVRHELTVNNRLVEELRADPDAQRRFHDSMHREKELLSRELDGRNHENQDLQKELDVRNHENQRLHEELDERNHEITRLHQELDERNREQQRAVARRDHQEVQLQEVHAELAEKSAELEALEDSHRSLRIEHDRVMDGSRQLGQQLDEARAEAARLQETIVGLEHRFEEILDSKSWRWTAPLRAVLKLVTGR